MASFFSIRGGAGLLLAALLWLTAGRAAAASVLSPAEATGGSFLRFSLSGPVDQWDGSAIADFFLWDGERPVPKEEIEVLAAVCRCRVEEEIQVLPLTVRDEAGSAAFRLVLPRRASCNIMVKLRYRGELHVVQALRTIYARGREPADWPKAADMPADIPYLDAEMEEGYNFRTGRPLAFTFPQGKSRPAEVVVYDKERRFLERLTVQEGFTYEVKPVPLLEVPRRGTREEVFFVASFAASGEPLYLHTQISALHDRRLYLNILHGGIVLLAAGGVTGAVILMRRRKRRRGV